MRPAGVSLFALSALAAGCANVIIPPERPTDPVPVYVLNHGYHTGLALPDGNAGMVEYTYGEKNWFALNQNGPLDALGVLMLSRPGSLARNPLGPAATAEEVRTVSGAREVLTVPVGRAEAAALTARLNGRYESRRNTAHLNDQTGLVHVDDDHTYNLVGHNCNHQLAEWLRELGCRVEGAAVTSDFVVRAAPEPAVARAAAAGR